MYDDYGYTHPDYSSSEYRYQYRSAAEPVVPEVKKEKKKGRLGGKLAAAAAMGLLFGAFGFAGFTAAGQGAKLLGIETKTTTAASTAAAPARSSYRSSAINSLNDSGDSSVKLTTGNTIAVVTDVTAVVDKVMPSIVSITNESTVNYYYYRVPSESRGSGIIIGSNDDELLIVTNCHVVANNDALTVGFTDGSSAKAVVKGSDADMDLAVVAVNLDDISDETMEAITIATIGDSESLKVGEPAIAIGNALGYGQSVTTGVISALDRHLDENDEGDGFIQTDAAINPGNSGGALLNINGEVVGINSSKIGGSAVEGMGYAIPISAAKPIIEQLMSRTTRTLVSEADRGYLGITGATVTAQEAAYYGYPEGVYVVNVNDGSAAADAGLQEGDCIVSFDGESITSMEGLQRTLMYYSEGETVEMEIERPIGNSYSHMVLQITLSDKSVF
ncbi:MAG: trypsin-like peptidase domain-containing protein [Lachnospiraceae bacterium]|nr:trypsin-like peptidase domain-containing protein [Lachnospiraceae bacterium]